jgi:spermidine synthase
MKGSTGRGKRPPRVRVQESAYGRELIVDETFASFYRPGTASTGSVWDAIALPLLLLPVSRRRRLMVLGLGGGSVARIARSLAPTAEIVGVEFDAEVVAVGRSAFGLDELGLEILIEDASRVLRDERRRFDMIFDDVFVGSGDAVHKPDWTVDVGISLACKRLRTGGFLVMNTLDEAAVIARRLQAAFEYLVEVRVDGFDNRIFVAGSTAFDARVLRAAVAREPLFAEALSGLSFRTR